MRILQLSLASAACCGAALAQSASILVTEGDTIPGVGDVTRVDNLEIGSDGTVLIEVDTDNSDTDADSVLLRDGVLFLREGQALASPAGATLGSFDGSSLAADGRAAFNLFLDGTTGTNDNSGLFLGSSLLIQEGATSTAPQFSPGTIYTGFFDVQFGDSSSVLVMASTDDPAIASTTDRALVVLSLDAAGNVVAESVIAKEGDLLPGQTESVADFETGAEEYSINASGSVLYTADLTGDTSVDRAIYLDQTLLLQEGSPSVVAGRDWGSLTSPELDLNDAGSWVVKANLDSSDTSNNEVIVRDGAIYRREGDTLPDIAPFTFQDFGGSVGVYLTPAGDVIWFGDWDDPDTSKDEGLFFNDTLILQEGVSVIGGQTIIDLADFTEALHVSQDGRRLVIEGEIDPAGTDLDVAILIELGIGTNYCTANPNSSGASATIAVEGSASVTANDVTLRATQVPPLAFGFFLTSQTQGFVQNPGGSAGNLCLAGNIGRYVGPGQIQNSGVQGVLTLAIDLTQTPQPTGFVSVQPGEAWNFQAWFRDSSMGTPTSNFTDGVSVTFE